MSTPILFKVTDVEGRSCNHGTGQFQYPLPTDDGPGEWTPAQKSLALCRSGYHLTAEPAKWWSGSEVRRLFIAEHRGKLVIKPGDKLCAESVRLVHEITPKWQYLPMFPVLRALLMVSWRVQHRQEKEWPAWANLTRATLYGATLYGANLDGARDVEHAHWEGAYVKGAIGLTVPDRYAVDEYGIVRFKPQ